MNRFRPLTRPEQRTSWGPKPEQPDFCRYESTHGQHPYELSILLRARFATSVRVRCRRPNRDFTESSRCHRPGRDQRPGEEPCLLRLFLRSISRPSLSRSSTRGLRSRSRVISSCERARGVPERTGNCPARDMGRGPEAKALLGDSRRKSPLLREPRTPRVVS